MVDRQSIRLYNINLNKNISQINLDFKSQILNHGSEINFIDNISIKEELHNKLEEFASHTDSLEEIHENKEQIEISKAYEKMPNPALLATQEFMEDKIY